MSAGPLPDSVLEMLSHILARTSVTFTEESPPSGHLAECPQCPWDFSTPLDIQTHRQPEATSGLTGFSLSRRTDPPAQLSRGWGWGFCSHRAMQGGRLGAWGGGRGGGCTRSLGVTLFGQLHSPHPQWSVNWAPGHIAVKTRPLRFQLGTFTVSSDARSRGHRPRWGQ